jgi:hypothetical protein
VRLSRRDAVSVLAHLNAKVEGEQTKVIYSLKSSTAASDDPVITKSSTYTPTSRMLALLLRLYIACSCSLWVNPIPFSVLSSFEFHSRGAYRRSYNAIFNLRTLPSWPVTTKPVGWWMYTSSFKSPFKNVNFMSMR